ncbi:hypothetical protein SAMN04487907_1186 [Zunongwangia mangrovi]|uniref:Lipocalin-like domain-containing protein n=1 Tax=Zunongwangia mangrovi TaxID=1334022 RepID=A0A1I1N8Q8_9FLAO|nr:hypothetical protein [Zunongwangia mangrovi]SFC93987.1 hypothetical protein SAMN04487907_1186 [Zunongwangia mangrovi]
MQKLIFLLFSILLISCSSDDDSNVSENDFGNLIVGNWYFEGDCGEEDLPQPRFEFYSDGTVSTNLFNSQGSGTYQVFQGELELIGYNAANENNRYTIEKIDENEMEWSYLNSGEKSYVNLIREDSCN